MARKLPGLTRALGEAPLASVAFGEIGSSLYFALGIVALYALGFTPWVLLIAGAVFVLVSLSYAEGTAAIPETGGAALFVSRAFNDPLGFVTGWALFLDYLIVIALAALFVPHYLAAALGWEALRDSPWDVTVGIAFILGLALIRLVRRPQMYALAVVVAVIAAIAFGLLVVVGLPFSFSADALTEGVDLGNEPEWREIAFALPLAMLAFTGLETVANLAAEAREPGRTLPRSLFAGIGAVVVVSFLIALVGISEFPAVDGKTALGDRWRLAPLAGVATATGEHLAFAGDVFRVGVALSGVLVLLAAVTTSMSGAGRLTYSLARHGMLPHPFERLNRRTLLSPAAILTTAAVASVLLVVTDVAGDAAISLASLYSFGVLLAFTAAQLAVWRLRRTEPDLKRPFRAPGMPTTALVGASLTAAVWVLAVATHGAARIVGPLWVLGGLLLFVAVRRSRGEALLEHVEPAEADIVPSVEGEYRQILVPVKLGLIGDEVMATAIRLAEEVGASITALHVITVPLDKPLDAELFDQEERAESSLAEAKILAGEHGVDVEGVVVRARSIGAAVVEEATARGVDLVLMGSAARWRRQSRFFSPTVDLVLRKAPCEVMVIAYPQGVLEEDGAPPAAVGATLSA